MIIDPHLLKWAVYRSLDNRTAPISSPAGNRTSEQVFREWRASPPDDETIIDTVTNIYLRSISQHQPGEPRIALKGKFPIPNTKPQKHKPALWVDWDARDPELLSQDEPHASGHDLVTIIRGILDEGDPQHPERS
jgi:hypothetical protein